MEQTIGKDYPAIQRVQFLKDNCDAIEETGYMKRFSPEQIQDMKDELSETDIKINDLEEEKSELTKQIKERLDPLKETRKTLLGNIKKKAEFVTEQCFKFIDPQEKTVGYYNSDGDLIDKRPASAEELQRTIFQINRTGTNN